MEKRHQVFVSSTYGDLIDERAEIIQAVLELDCIPAGMELFPATTEAAWELIKAVIDDSDYYCLVIGGRYGSVDPQGVSYTEREYDYAVLQKKPVMAFVHADPQSIPTGKSESSDEGRRRLEDFRKKVESTHHRKAWSTAAELGGLVSRSLVNLRKNHPAEGWVRGRFAATDSLLVEVANLRARVAELTSQLSNSQSNRSVKSDQFASGDDPYVVQLKLKMKGSAKEEKRDIKVTWNQILKYVGPALINECDDSEFYEKLKLCFYHAGGDSELDYSSIVLPFVVRDQIKIQLQALGLIGPGAKRRAVADRKTYWKLTSYGEAQLIAASAIPKQSRPVNVLASALQTLAATSSEAG